MDYEPFEAQFVRYVEEMGLRLDARSEALARFMFLSGIAAVTKAMWHARNAAASLPEAMENVKIVSADTQRIVRALRDEKWAGELDAAFGPDLEPVVEGEDHG